MCCVVIDSGLYVGHYNIRMSLFLPDLNCLRSLTSALLLSSLVVRTFENSNDVCSEFICFLVV